jgi:formate--tetrahydrofolate ligase
MHGGGPAVVPGRPLPEAYTKQNLGLVEKGLENLLHHLKNVKKSGINPVVCINKFASDTKEEINLIKRVIEQSGGRCALSDHWRYGGDGALELADAVIDACKDPVDFKFLYPLEMPLRQRVDIIAKEVYGADGVDWAPEAEAKAKRFEADPRFRDFQTMMVKTHLSLSHDPALKGVPKNWRLPIRDVLVYAGARFLCPHGLIYQFNAGYQFGSRFRRNDMMSLRQS